MCIRDRCSGVISFSIRGGREVAVKFMDSLSPVSYTHLDVYKRQSLSSVPFARKMMIHPYSRMSELVQNGIMSSSICLLYTSRCV